jgi:hypothetical protein
MPTKTHEPIFLPGGITRLIVALTCFIAGYHAFHWIVSSLTR